MPTFKCLLVLLLILSSLTIAQWTPTPNDTLKSITIMNDGKITFRIYAPYADEAALGGPDIPAPHGNKKMEKQENGVWEVSTGPIEPGAYRYSFIVDRVSVLDPKNPAVSESNANSWSLLYIPGQDFMDLKDVPHGAVSEITYFSKSLNRFRRMHVYTPAGYQNNNNKYPVFYLLHGALDCDDSWSTIGRAGIILDNLIAANKAVPMILVMPAGHTGPFSFADRRERPFADEFVDDFNKDIKPYIEKNFRIYTDRKNQAIAGLSMGGGHTLNIAIPNLKDYSYIGVFSSGVFENAANTKGPLWEERNKESLENRDLKKGLSLVWFATGKNDFLLNMSRATVEMLKKHGFEVVYKETEGAHDWKNWREYLNEFAQFLFKAQGT